MGEPISFARYVLLTELTWSDPTSPTAPKATPAPSRVKPAIRFPLTGVFTSTAPSATDTSVGAPVGFTTTWASPSAWPGAFTVTLWGPEGIMNVPSPPWSAPSGSPSMKTWPWTLPALTWMPPLGGPPVSSFRDEFAIFLRASSFASVRLAE
jgi:hypothetical protein